MTTYSRILVPIDLGEQSRHILQHAKAIADRFDSSIELLYCVPNPVIPDATGLLSPLSPEWLDEARGDAQQKLNDMLTGDECARYRAKATVLVGDPLHEIVEHARRQSVHLIVMGTHGRTGLTHMFLGSVAERDVRTAPCPVLTVH